MLDSGNFVLYNKTSSIIWQSFDYPTDTILGDQSLPSGGQLLSSSSETNHSTGRFHLVMQADGNLVLYPLHTADTPADAYWASDNSGHNGFKFHLYLNKTGSLLIRNGSDLKAINYLYDDSSLAININNENQTIYRAALDSDGVFRLYVHMNNGSGNHTVASWPNVDNACKVKSFCGFDSYCTLNDDQPYCNCLRGFDFIDPTQKTLGCKMNFSEAGCSRGEKDNAAFYNMIPMKSTVWGDRPCVSAKMSQEEECSSSCLADCNCWAALYRNGLCHKQEQPLRYVVRQMDSDSDPENPGQSQSMAFLKVGNKGLENWSVLPEPPQPPPVKSTSNRAIVQIILVTSGFTLLLCSTIAVSSHFIYKIRVLRR